MLKQYHSTSAFEIQALKNGENNATAIKELFRIIWIKEGAGTLSVDMHTHTISSNCIYCIKPGQVMKFEPEGETDGYSLSFSPEFLAMAGVHTEPLQYASFSHPLSPFSIVKVENSLEMLEVAEKMIREFSNAYPGKVEILRGLLKIFLVYLNRLQEEPQPTLSHLHQSGLASRFFSLLEKDFINRKMVSDYAQDLSVTPNYLNEIVKRASGFPASFHIRQRIILEAKRKAAYVRTSMKEIAYDLGFDDISHFSKYFKKASGISFSDFRKEISQQFSFAS
ncbi:helix-turn-helix transcriptional regulator [Flavitalea sp. BT771]|uniref:AraC family transcriptional regulator n=1 Tax=Flavitalea sp. BT771 TaxID=3063329 RepID=UPI0026E30E5B|nr:helix-turn-helix transcriptional regulator [Flavitalea sp. BT771]MDO6429582.1 helix-turn-helix transcriptional regulator [Flavitalea sp. BT771]MDV6218290.1 helix-turn-helix transcriptional regulator [Flavitalea sp. BT771]